MFYDTAHIIVSSGKGGNGAATFRREKYITRGGPDGGSGGQGGSIILRANARLNTLTNFRHITHYHAADGGHGERQNRHGENGEDLILDVPIGTVVRRSPGPLTWKGMKQKASVEKERGKLQLEEPVIVADLAQEGQQYAVVRGGKGGMGNELLATPTYKAPMFAQLGEPGQQTELDLELKLIADVGLIGYPSVGKSTLISVISNAKPKIAAYPFTTLIPNLGVVKYQQQDFVVADIPGLIEGAHQGKGLGHEFLRHVERTRVLIHLLDPFDYGQLETLDQRVEKLVHDLHSINHELVEFNPKLKNVPQIIGINKIDLLSGKQLEELQQEQRLQQAVNQYSSHPLLFLSAATKKNLDPLLYQTNELLAQVQLKEETSPPPVVKPLEEEIDQRFEIEQLAEDHWRITGQKVELIVLTTPLNNTDALRWMHDRLGRLGLHKELINRGVEAGHTVEIAGFELEWE